MRVVQKSLLISVLGIFVVAFAIRLHFALRCTAIPDYSDMAWYNEVALQHGFPKELPPSYPLFLRAIYGVFGANNYRAVFVAQGLIGALTAALICWITSRVGNLKAGITAGGIAAIYPNLIVYTLTTLTETFGVFFVVLLLAVLAAAIGERKRSVLAAIVLLLGSTFRPVIMFFAPGVFLSLRKKLVFLIACAVVIAPALAYEMTAGMTFNRAARAFYKTYYPAPGGNQFVDPTGKALGSETLPKTVYLKAALNNIASDEWRVVNQIYNKGAIVFSRGWDEHVAEPLISSAGNTSRLMRVTHAAVRGRVSGDWPISNTLSYVMEYAYVPIMLLGFIGIARLYGKRNRMLVLPALSYLAFMVLFCIFKVRYRLLVEPIGIMFCSLLVWAGRARPAGPAAEVSVAASTGSPRRGLDWIIVSVVFAGAMALRLYVAIACNPSADFWVGNQFKQVALHGGFGSDGAPLYPLFLRAVYAILGEGNDRAVCVIQAILGASIVFLMYATASRLGGRRAGFIAAGISALYPAFIGYGIGMGVEWSVVLLVGLLMAAAAAPLADRTRAMLSAVIVGLAMLVQPVLTWLAPGAFLAMKRRVIFLVALIIVLAPFTIRNAVLNQWIDPVYEPGAFHVGLMHLKQASVWDIVGSLYGSANQFLTKGPLLVDAADLKNPLFDKGLLASYLYAVFMLLGFFGLARYYRKVDRGVVLPVLLYIVVLVLFAGSEVALRVPLEPVLIVYASILLGGRREGPMLDGPVDALMPDPRGETQVPDPPSEAASLP